MAIDHANHYEDAIHASRVPQWRLIVPADIPIQQPLPPSPVGEHPALERPCDRAGCHALTTRFLAVAGRIMHFCANHESWAYERLAQLEGMDGWWREARSEKQA